MIWKGIGLLVGAAALVAVGVAALALVVVPDEPRFSDALEEETDIEEDFVPDALGARLEISGARDDTVVLDDTVGGPTFGLGNSRTRIFFEGDPLAIGQMSHDGLAFFPEPEECEFTPGEHNEEAGLIAVRISCTDLVDIRDNGSITLEGVAALPADLVIELDLPETGGAVTVGDQVWEIVDPLLFIGPRFRGDPMTAVEFLLWTREARQGLGLRYNDETGLISLATVYYDDRSRAVGPADCIMTDEDVMILNPQTQFRELTIECANVDAGDLGTVEITGTVLYQKTYFTDS